ncbi:DUF6285 domain-containing protein [Kibdelosporangium aridum]|uniref:DUF6285 domain-containing protein n=1 Tax=Kibdelosporangium aridum TaxID=2030 RepID=A0A1W2FXA9_KIBAR|nr:DUF6285 domain-containing protein [Kibdelosporangium aridum]SMD26382.1 hypothetical protein SAMN05661093_09965 [Kibdelosporangium aridum]
MQHVPDAAGLVQAVAEWLDGLGRTSLSGTDRFHALVAANALRIVERELQAGPNWHARDRAAFAGFLTTGTTAADDAELATSLARRISAGDLDDRVPELLAALHGYTVRRVSVDNPKYLLPEDRP